MATTLPPATRDNATIPATSNAQYLSDGGYAHVILDAKTFTSDTLVATGTSGTLYSTLSSATNTLEGLGTSDTLYSYSSANSLVGNGLSGSSGTYLQTTLSTVTLSAGKISGIANLIDTSTVPGSLFGSALLAGTIQGAATGAGDTFNDNGLLSNSGDTLIDTTTSGRSLFIVSNVNDSIVGNSQSGANGSLIQTSLPSYNLGSILVSGVYNLKDTLPTGATLIGSASGPGTLTGGTGADSISDGGVTGSQGDTLVGGGGKDTFVVTNLNDSIYGNNTSLIQTTLSSFNLNTASFHSNVYNLSYIGTTNNASLEGSSLVGGTIKGSAAAAMTLQADVSGTTLDDGGVRVVSNGVSLGDTLNANGKQVTFIVSNANDYISAAGSGSSIISSVSYNLGSSKIDGDISILTYIGSGDAVLTGNNSLNGNIIDASSTSGNVTIKGEASSSNIVGGKGNNTLYGYGDTVGGATLDGSSGQFTKFIVTSADDTIIGGIKGNDVIQTSCNNFNLGASTGQGLVSNVHNLIYTGTSAATLVGNGTSSETLDGSSSTAGVSLSGAGFNSTLIGGSGDDSLNGVGYSSLFGGLGLDAFYSQNGNNTLNGAVGRDTFYVGTTTDTIIGNSLTGSLGSTIQTTATSFNLSSSMVSGVANLIYTGLSSATLTGTSLSGSIIGNAASSKNEILSDGDSGLAVSTLQGGGGTNQYLVSNARDRIIDAKAYTELYTGGSATITGNGNNQSNLIDASGATGGVKLWGGTVGAYTLIGSDQGNNLLYAADAMSPNTLIASGGGNSFYVYATFDSLCGSGITGAGGDTVFATGSFNLDANSTGIGNLIHQGSRYSAVLTGSSTQPGSLIGSPANDTFVGAGDNTLIGGTGTNTYQVSSTTDTIIDHGHNSWIYSSVDYDLSSASVSGVNNLGHYGTNPVSLSGNSNADSLSGQCNGDTLIGNGLSTLIGGNGDNAFVVSSTTDHIVDYHGTNTIYSSVSYNLSSSLVSGLSNLVYTGLGDASLSGNTQSNLISIIGESGDDTLSDGGGGADTLIGGTGKNTYIVSSAKDSIQGSDSDTLSVIRSSVGFNLGSSLVSGVINLVYTGNSGVSLTGSSSSDSIVGGSGNDTLADGGGGSDTLVGGAGANTYIVSRSTDKITDAGAGSVIRSSVGFNLGSFLVSGVNKLVYTGAGDAILSGGSGSDSIVGGAGNDTLSDGGRGSDTLVGGTGANTYIVSSSTDRITDAGSGSVIRTALSSYSLSSALVSGVNNLLYSGSGNASLLGNTKPNIINASAATSGVSLNGGTGKDTLLGGSGNDTLVGNGSASLVGGVGANTYIVSSVADSINDIGSGGVIRSSVGFSLGSSLVSGVNNLVYTGTGNVSLVGNTSANSITGSSGKDTIQGWSGSAASNSASDTLSGGSGADNFILSAALQTDNAYGNGSGAVAKITDFQGGSTGDKLLLHNFGTGHAGSSGYQTLSGGLGVLDVYSYLGADPSHLVAHVTLASGTFSWGSNASFV